MIQSAAFVARKVADNRAIGNKCRLIKRSAASISVSDSRVAREKTPCIFAFMPGTAITAVAGYTIIVKTAIGTNHFSNRTTIASGQIIGENAVVGDVNLQSEIAVLGRDITISSGVTIPAGSIVEEDR